MKKVYLLDDSLINISKVKTMSADPQYYYIKGNKKFQTCKIKIDDKIYECRNYEGEGADAKITKKAKINFEQFEIQATAIICAFQDL